MEGSQPPSDFLGRPKISPLRPQGGRVWLLQWTLYDQKFSGARRHPSAGWQGQLDSGQCLQGPLLLDEMSYGPGSLRAAGVCHPIWKGPGATNPCCHPGWGRSLPATSEGQGTGAQGFTGPNVAIGVGREQEEGWWWQTSNKTSQLPLRPLATTGWIGGYSGVFRQAIP